MLVLAYVIYFNFKALKEGLLKEKLLVTGLFLSFIGMLLVSTFRSWFYDFQPQGRYLFPILGMAALGIYQFREKLNGYLPNTIFFLFWVLSFYSFVYQGLFRLW